MSKHSLTLQDQTTEFLLYTAPNGAIKVEVLLSNESIWQTQERMAQLFGVQRPAITKHLKNIFESNELQEEVVCSILEHTTTHGAIEGKTQTSKAKYYNLDAVISVGYRVNSAQATEQFLASKRSRKRLRNMKSSISSNASSPILTIQ